jgi:hypothetical protein
MKKREAFISLKDRKENFENNLKCRLINPAKSESGKLSKVILDKVNSNLRDLNYQWRSVEKQAKSNRMVWQHKGKTHAFLNTMKLI